MRAEKLTSKVIPLFLPHSSTSTATNKTGSWRYFRPCYDEKTSPCSAACPLGEDIAQIEMLVGQKSLLPAWEILVKKNPLPATCGRVCFHHCEEACNRGRLDEPVAIRHLERFIGDAAIHVQPAPELKVLADNGKTVAIAGAGPAGLGAAYFLARLGYRCEVFEARPEAGGILRWGIPTYRLPQDMIDKFQKAGEKKGGSRFIHIFASCTTGWGASADMSVKIARLAV